MSCTMHLYRGARCPLIAARTVHTAEAAAEAAEAAAANLFRQLIQLDIHLPVDVNRASEKIQVKEDSRKTNCGL